MPLYDVSKGCPELRVVILPGLPGLGIITLVAGFMPGIAKRERGRPPQRSSPFAIR